MECPKCGYVMGPFDEECERCRRMAQERSPVEQELAHREREAEARQSEEGVSRPPTFGATAAPSNIPPPSQSSSAGAHTRRVVPGIAILVTAMVLITWVVLRFHGRPTGITPVDYLESGQPRTGARQSTAPVGSPEATALDALIGLQAAVRVGVSYRTYPGYLIETKQEVERARRRARSISTPFWSSASQAIDEYEFAYEAWSWKFDDEGVSEFVRWRDDLGDARCRWIRARYPDFEFTWFPPFAVADIRVPGYWAADIDAVLQSAWASASRHIANAERSGLP